MSKVCLNCKNSVDLGVVTDGRKVMACREAFYYKTKYDNSKKLKLTSFVPVVYEDDSCIKFEVNNEND